MKKNPKLMVYVRSDLAPEVTRWAFRLSQNIPEFCNGCVGDALSNMERGLDILWPDMPPNPWRFVDIWKMRQGKPPRRMKLDATAIQRLQVRHQREYRNAQPKLEEFEKALQAGNANTKILFQIYEGEGVERSPEKLRRMAQSLQIKPNELANRMIATGITALEREESSYEPDFVAEYRNKVVIPRIEQFRSEQKLAEQFDIYADVPRNLTNDGRAFVLVTENANLHFRAMFNGLRERKSFEEAIPYVFRDERLSRSYADKLRKVYDAYRDLGEPGPLREKELKKEVLDALVEEWRSHKFPSGSSVIEEITSKLPKLTDDGLKTLHAEIGLLLSKRAKKPRKKE